jgi:prepilin-type N-terminal cleavage/methylation domain-containing protein
MKRENKELVRQIHPPYVVAGKCGGLTLMELLIVLAIISMLVGLLLPAFSAVRKAAREAKQKAQLTGIELAISAFKEVYGDYPPSAWPGPPSPDNYCGSQKLAEALLGWDLLGFHPKSAWRADGLDINGGEWTYDPLKKRVRPDGTFETLYERKGPYLELATANAFRLGDSPLGDGLFTSTAGSWGGSLEPKTFVICDVFSLSEKKITLPNGKRVAPGTPVLYYRANTSSKIINPANPIGSIYNFQDNFPLINLRRLTDCDKPLAQRRPHRLEDINVFYSADGGIIDPKVVVDATDPKKLWPYRPDSYILISAGADGFYGTQDDICNFGN